MADLTRAEELVQAMERDDAFRAAVAAAPTAEAKRRLLDARGYQDVGLEDMKAWVESKGGTLTLQQGGRELSDEELAAVAGGMTNEEIGITAGVVGGSFALSVGATIGIIVATNVAAAAVA